jgi:hypothetical protein
MPAELADEIGGDVEDDAGNEPRGEEEDGYDDDDDEMDDFIADAPRRRKKASSGVGRLTGDALQVGGSDCEGFNRGM